MKTAEQVKADFARKGITMSAWAKANSFKYTVVQQVLKGRLHGHYGEAHRIAVKLGLKAGEVIEPDQVSAAFDVDRRATGTGTAAAGSASQ